MAGDRVKNEWSQTSGGRGEIFSIEKIGK